MNTLMVRGSRAWRFINTAIIGLVALYLIAAEFIDTIGRMELIQNRWPKAWSILSNRPMRLVLTVFMILLLAGDWAARLKEPQTPRLVVTFQAPPAPIVKEEAPGRTEAGHTTTTVVKAPVTQTTNAPCSANNVGGKVDLTDCNPPKNPYLPVFTYDPNGTKHGASANTDTLDDSLQEVSRQWQQLQKDRRWTEILSLTEATQKTDPGWFSLDYMSALAHLNLCQTSEATRDLKKFYSETTAIPIYASLHDDAAKYLNVPSTYAYKQKCSGQTR